MPFLFRVRAGKAFVLGRLQPHFESKQMSLPPPPSITGAHGGEGGVGQGRGRGKEEEPRGDAQGAAASRLLPLQVAGGGGRKRQGEPGAAILWRLPGKCLPSPSQDSLAMPPGRAGQCHSRSLRPAKNSGAGEKCSLSQHPWHQPCMKPAILRMGSALALLLEQMWNLWPSVVTSRFSGKHFSRILTCASEVDYSIVGCSQDGSNARQEWLGEQPGASS